MSTIHSQNYYFKNGDITLLIDGVLFKLHRDMIEMHSIYFQDIIQQIENGDDPTTSDEHPLVLPAGVCSAETFGVICQFLYPRAVGVLPEILIQEQEKWDSVLQATIPLQMSGLRKHVLANFKGELHNNPGSAAKLLGMAVKYNDTPNSLKLRCLYTLVFLRRAISATEFVALGENATSQVVAIRDRIRILIAATPGYWTTIHRHYLCLGGTSCQNFIHERVFNDLKDTDPLQEYYRTDSSIFDIPEDNRICANCGPIRIDLAGTMAKDELGGEIRRCGVGLGLLTVEE
ncbi:unnamed protein product [Rhizoctonia solani]|uniref:BTB domain-containing protein n=1 Tax=Rhizoctonia solani TaxID=456999 RepID=A0A8H2W8C9_9AGAM|nr:unnamed protein product [Rhizoctonia solani]